jgi:hypothetical protein
MDAVVPECQGLGKLATGLVCLSFLRVELPMHRHTYQKFFFNLSLFGIAASILVGFYDVIFHFLLDMCHTIFEVIEMGLDKLIEQIFETDLRETQIIVFYIICVIGGVLIYLAWKALVQLFSGTGQVLVNEWTELKEAVIQDWQEMTMTNRIFFISAFLLVNYLASFLLF